MRYIIIGAGAIGGGIGGRLHESGREVVLVARGPHLDALRDGGLRLSTHQGDRTLGVRAVGGPGELELEPDDVLVLAVKSQHTPGILEEWSDRPVAGGGTAEERLPLLCAQNGVNNERLALRWFRQVYGVCVWMPATHLEPGRVALAGTPVPGILHLGRYPSGSDATVGAIAADLERAGFRVPVPPDVMRWKYAKLIGNLGNAVDALAGRAADGPVAELLRRLRAEGERVLTAAGIAYAGVEEQSRARTGVMASAPLEGVELGGSSSRQSLARGTGTIEADYLNGEIALLAREHGIPAPVNEALARLANTWAREARVPGSLPQSELVALLAL